MRPLAFHAVDRLQERLEFPTDKEINDGITKRQLGRPGQALS